MRVQRFLTIYPLVGIHACYVFLFLRTVADIHCPKEMKVCLVRKQEQVGDLGLQPTQSGQQPRGGAADKRRVSQCRK